MMMMAEEGIVNVISLELAIRKELAYRKKVASLYPDSEEDLLPLKDPCPTKASTGNASSSQLHETSPSRSIPRAQNPSFMQGEDSVSWQCPMNMGPTMNMGPNMYVGPNTNMNMGPTYPGMEGTSAGILPCYASQQPPPPPPTPLYDVNSLFFCKVCKVPCSSQVSYKQHLKGQKHRAKLQLHQMIRNGNGPKKPQQPKCNVCEIWCSDENALRLHFLGQKHKAKLLETGQGDRGRQSQQRWCQVCHVPCTSEDAFRLHLQGKNHLALVRAMGEKKKII